MRPTSDLTNEFEVRLEKRLEGTTPSAGELRRIINGILDKLLDEAQINDPDERTRVRGLVIDQRMERLLGKHKPRRRPRGRISDEHWVDRTEREREERLKDIPPPRSGRVN